MQNFTLDFAYIGRLRAFLTLGDFKAYAVSLGKRFETVTLDFGKVNEYVRAVVLLDETKTFCVVKPFYCTFCHFFLHIPFVGTFCCVNALVQIKKHIPKRACVFDPI